LDGSSSYSFHSEVQNDPTITECQERLVEPGDPLSIPIAPLIDVLYNTRAVNPSNAAPRTENVKARLSVRPAPLPVPEAVEEAVPLAVDEPV